MRITADENWDTLVSRLCCIADAAEMLDLKESRVKDFCLSGCLRATKLGRSWLLDRLSVEELAKARMRS